MPKFNVRLKLTEFRYFQVEAADEKAAGEIAIEQDCQGAEPYEQAFESREADLVVQATVEI